MNINQIEEKVTAGERINDEEALYLLDSNNIHALGRMSEIVRQRWNGNKAYYIVNRHINYSNVCVDDCKFCSFARKSGEKGAFTYSTEQMLDKAERGAAQGANEFHIVGGLHPDLPYDYYLNIINAIHEKYPHIHLKAFTAVEISHFAHHYNLSIEQVLKDLIQAGLGSLPGGGAEMFSQRVRDIMCPGKLYVEEWIDVHRTAHNLGLNTNATMLYGHVEKYEEIVDHMAHLRPLQDETNGFKTFIPLHFISKNTRVRNVMCTGLKDMKVHSVARIYLDNFPHIKAYWTMLGVKAAQVILRYGADDFDGTVIDEKIVHMACADSPKMLTVSTIKSLIKEAGCEPIERDTLFNPIERTEPLPVAVA